MHATHACTHPLAAADVELLQVPALLPNHLHNQGVHPSVVNVGCRYSLDHTPSLPRPLKHVYDTYPTRTAHLEHPVRDRLLAPVHVQLPQAQPPEEGQQGLG